MGLELLKRGDTPAATTETDSDEQSRLLHELRLQQIKLETQNAELRAAKAALEESRARFADLYDFAPSAYATLDKTGCIREINVNGAAMLGRSRAALVGRHFLAFVNMDDPEVFWGHLSRCSQTLEKVVTELSFSTGKTGPRTVQAVSVPLFDSMGQVLGYRTAFNDITEMRVALRARDNLLAVVSHDLGSPLCAIRFGAGILSHPSAVGDSALLQKQVGVIQRSVEQMGRLISDLIQAGTIEAGHFEIATQPEEVLPLIHDILQSEECAAASKSIRLECDLPEHLPKVTCDRQRILQVLSNLVGNAIKFSPQGSAVVIWARATPEDVCFAVTDSGPGISSDDLPQVFDHYWKGKSKNHGTGLGLYISKGIIELHRGAIWVETAVGIGSTFCFTLPIASP